MICVQILTRRREQTLTRFTNAMLHLFFAGWMPEICCRTANIMNISFKVLIFCNFFCFFNQRFMTSYLDNSSLMERQCAKTASSKTSSVADQTEFNLLDCRNSAFCLVRRMVSPLEESKHHPSPSVSVVLPVDSVLHTDDQNMVLQDVFR